MRTSHHTNGLLHQNKGNKGSRHNFPFLKIAAAIPPMYWQYFQGVTLDSRMGFTGSRQFHSLGQAINWAKSDIGYSWSNKSFCKPISLDVLLSRTASTIPHSMVSEIKRYFTR